MQVVASDIWLCSDCTIVAVNDDVSGIDEGSERETERRIHEIYAGLEALGPNLVSDDTEHDQAICGECGWHGDESERVKVYTDPEYPDWAELGCPQCKETEDIEVRDNGRLEFSWNGCDCCGSMLGGSLTRFAILGPDEPSPQAEMAV